MGIFNRDYSKPGKGVDESGEGSEGAVLFFEIFIRKFWKLIQVNLLFCVANIPAFLILFYLTGMFSNAVLGSFPNQIAGIAGLSAPDFTNPDFLIIYRSIDLGVRAVVTILFCVFWGSGPAYAAMHYVLRNYSREEHSFILSDFWDALKDNFKQSLAVFVIDIIFMFLFFYGIFFYSSRSGIISYAKYLVYCLFAFYTISHLFVYPLMVRYRLKFTQLLRNSALFAIASLPYSILVIIILAALTLGMWYVGIFMLSGAAMTSFLAIYVLAMLVLLNSVCGFIVSFNAERQIRRHLSEDANVEEKQVFEKNTEPVNPRKMY